MPFPLFLFLLNGNWVSWVQCPCFLDLSILLFFTPSSPALAVPTLWLSSHFFTLSLKRQGPNCRSVTRFTRPSVFRANSCTASWHLKNFVPRTTLFTSPSGRSTFSVPPPSPDTRHRGLRFFDRCFHISRSPKPLSLFFDCSFFFFVHLLRRSPAPSLFSVKEGKGRSYFVLLPAPPPAFTEPPPQPKGYPQGCSPSLSLSLQTVVAEFELFHFFFICDLFFHAPPSPGPLLVSSLLISF